MRMRAVPAEVQPPTFVVTQCRVHVTLRISQCDLSPTFSLAALGAYVIKLRSRLCIRRARDPTLEMQAGFSSKNAPSRCQAATA